VWGLPVVGAADMGFVETVQHDFIKINIVEAA